MLSLSKVKSFMFFSILVVAMALLGSAPALAQVLTGNIKGTVVDANGASLSGASVTAKSQATGVESKTVTGSEGTYIITNLVPGKYTVTIEQTGFKKKEVKDLNVSLGDNSMSSQVLEIGSPTETVTVTAGTEEIIQRDQSQIASSFETRKIEELPSNVAGGGIDTLALLAPGVVNNPGAFTNTNGAGLSVNGQ